MKHFVKVIDWFIPPAFLRNPKILMFARLEIGSMILFVLLGLGLSLLVQAGWWDIQLPVFRSVLVIAGGLAILRISSPFILDDQVVTPSSLPIYRESGTVEVAKSAFLQRLAMMIVFMLLPMIIYASLFLSHFQIIQLIVDEFVLLGIIILIGVGRLNLALMIIICAFYSLVAFSPIMFIPLNGSQLGIIAIFLGVAYSNTDARINFLNIVLAIASMVIYKYLEYFHPSAPITDPFWIDLLLTVTLLVVIVLTIRYYLIDRNAYRDRIRKNEQFLTQILDLHPHMIFVKDQSGRLAFVNSPFLDTFYSPEEQVIGKRSEQLLANPDEAKRFVQDDRQVLQEGLTKHIPEEKVTKRDGEEVWVETIKTPIRDAKGTIVGVLGLSTNITEKKLTEQALQETKDRYRMIIEHTPIGITSDHLGWISSSNPALRDIMGYPKEELESMHCSQLIFPEDLDRTNSLIDEVVRGERKSAAIELRIVRKDQTIRSILLQIQARFNQKNEYVESIASVVDITEKKSQEQLIQQQLIDLDEKNKELKKYIESNLQLENFAYLASHDLKAPIRTIVSFGQLLAKSLSDKIDEREKEFLQFIISASSNLHRLTQDLLSYSRVQTERRQFESIDLEQELHHLVKELDSSILEANAQVFFHQLPSQIVADRTFIRQVFQNLISNAIKFCKVSLPPVVSIYATELIDSWKFEVKDNGIGIDSQYFDKIFLLFQKLHPNERYDGSGIGLAICRKITDLHQGKIWVQSVPGEGSSIFFTISKSLEPTEQYLQSPTADSRHD